MCYAKGASCKTSPFGGTLRARTHAEIVCGERERERKRDPILLSPSLLKHTKYMHHSFRIPGVSIFDGERKLSKIPFIERCSLFQKIQQRLVLRSAAAYRKSKSVRVSFIHSLLDWQKLVACCVCFTLKIKTLQEKKMKWTRLRW